MFPQGQPSSQKSQDEGSQDFTSTQQSLDEGSLDEDFTSSQQDQGRPVAEDQHFPVYYTNMLLGEPYPPQNYTSPQWPASHTKQPSTRRRQLAPYPKQNPERSRQPDPNVTRPTSPLRRLSPYPSQTASQTDVPSTHAGSTGASASLPSSSSRLDQLRGAGIQGGRYSSSIDATLFSMFAYTTFFDSYLNVDQEKSAEPDFSHIIEHLRTNIINPLRKDLYVDANTTQTFITLIAMDVLKQPIGLAFESMRAEEFIILLLSKLFRCDHFLDLSYQRNATRAFTLCLDNTFMNFPSVQMLLDANCKQKQLKFRKMPACLILVMPLAFDAASDQGQHPFELISPNKNIHIRNHMTDIEEGKSYELELISAVCNSGPSYWSFNRVPNGEWVYFSSKPESKYPSQGSSMHSKWIPTVEDIYQFSGILTSQKPMQGVKKNATAAKLFRFLRICFYVDSGRL